ATLRDPDAAQRRAPRFPAPPGNRGQRPLPGAAPPARGRARTVRGEGGPVSDRGTLVPGKPVAAGWPSHDAGDAGAGRGRGRGVLPRADPLTGVRGGGAPPRGSIARTLPRT